MNLNRNQEPDDFEDFGDQLARNTGPRKQADRLVSRTRTPAGTDGQDNTDDAGYAFTYHASRHEKQWLMASIHQFHQEDWIEDILKMVRGGKEASVYLCSRPAGSNPSWIAAKVYRPRHIRNLKNDYLFREGGDQVDTSGQVIHDDRSLHAMRKRTSYGRELPRPFASSDNAILIDFIGDESYPVLTLNTVTLRAAEARQLFKRVMYHIKLMLRFNRIHADPSAYNFLYWRGGIKLIDFPQAIHPDENRNAYCIFASDVERVCEYFTSQGIEADPAGLARGYGNPGGGR